MEYSFLEYVSGGTIDSCVKAFGKLREDVTKYFTRQILEGLAYLHSGGILHRVCQFLNWPAEPPAQFIRLLSGFESFQYTRYG